MAGRWPHVVDRFRTRVELTPTCWLWKGQQSNGYGRIGIGYSFMWVHRFSYTLFRGPIPKGLHIDHLCCVPLCVNPFHLEPVTQAENVRRIYQRAGHHNSKKTHCPQGHEYTPENTKTSKVKTARTCRTCARAASLRWWNNNRKGEPRT